MNNFLYLVKLYKYINNNIHNCKEQTSIIDLNLKNLKILNFNFEYFEILNKFS